MKQTAVEWFFWKLYVLKEVKYESIMELYEQAKEMEKEQIIEAFNKGFATPQWDKEKENKAKQYYDETFKSE